MRLNTQLSQFLENAMRINLNGLILGFALLVSLSLSAQNVQRNYKVLFNGEDIGWLRLEADKAGSKVNLQLTSEIKTKIVFPVTVVAKEFSTFEDGKLIYSSQFRTTNGTTKLDKQTKLVGDRYVVSEDGEKEELSFASIYATILCLYFQEPVNLETVYCEKRSSVSNIKKTKDGGYEIKFSNGNSNCFYYEDGVCTKVKIEHLFYQAEIVFSP
ncbi:hypothetical protein Q767_03865 [Flavobacterium enshiense DK69]|uniref:DUF3108 domain-containing protein n=2 Tax=Flavobacterium TaxID=237 RepID=A0A0A2MZ08_9FLAO|nr:hypothetical protein Q767_03865 [Flavobacterium enshiense DK69]